MTYKQIDRGRVFNEVIAIMEEGFIKANKAHYTKTQSVLEDVMVDCFTHIAKQSDDPYAVPSRFISATMETFKLLTPYLIWDKTLYYNVIQRLAKLNITSFIASSFIYLLYGEVIEQVDHEVKDEYEQSIHAYPYIPYRHSPFIRLIKQLTKAGYTGNFIDVGSGIGDKVILASIFGKFDTCNGIEYNKDTFKIAFGNWYRYHDKRINFVQGDAFQYDFSNMDVIYLYHPINDGLYMRKLYRHILASMKVGAIMVEVLDYDLKQMIQRSPVSFAFNDNLYIGSTSISYTLVKKIGKGKYEFYSN